MHAISRVCSSSDYKGDIYVFHFVKGGKQQSAKDLRAFTIPKKDAFSVLKRHKRSIAEECREGCYAEETRERFGVHERGVSVLIQALVFDISFSSLYFDPQIFIKVGSHSTNLKPFMNNLFYKVRYLTIIDEGYTSR